MKKGRLAVTLAAVLGLSCSAVALAACGTTVDPNNPSNPNEPANPNEPTVTTHTVTFDYNDGATANTTVTVNDGEKVTKPADPTRASYVFEGWFNGNTAYNFDTAVTSDLTLKANWELQFTVTYEIPDTYGEATAPAAQKAVGGETVTVAAAPELNDWWFVEWSDGTNVYDAGDTITVNDNITLTATYTEVKEKLYINLYDGFGTEPYDRIEVDPKQKGTLPETAAAHAGFTFSEWIVDSKRLDSMIMDVDAYAKYTSDYLDFTLVEGEGEAKDKYTVAAKSEQPQTALESIAIPSKWNGLDVEIAAGSAAGVDTAAVSAFKTLNAQKVEISEGIKAVADFAFFDNKTISEVTLPASVETLGESAFDKSSVATFNFAANGKLATIGKHAFQSCVDLNTVSIPASVVTIGEEAFYNSHVSSVTFAPECKLETIDAYAFQDTAITSITIPKSVTTLGEGVFYYTDAGWSSGWGKELEVGASSVLASVTFEPGIKLETIPKNCFYGAGLTSVEIPASVKTIGDKAFMYAGKLATLTFAPNSELTTIGVSAFDCANSKYTNKNFRGSLEAVDLSGTKVKTIGEKAFARQRLGKVVLSNCVTDIGKWAFVAVNQTNECPAAADYEYGTLLIPASLTNLTENAFDGRKFKRIEFAANSALTEIKGNTFKKNPILEEIINIPKSVTSIGDSAFNGSSNLKAITFEDGGTEPLTIGNGSFSATSSDAGNPFTVTLPSRLTSMGTTAFSNLKGNKSFIITSQTPPTIAANTFDKCDPSVIIYFSDALPTDANWQSNATRLAIKNAGATEGSVTIHYAMPTALAGLTSIATMNDVTYKYNDVKVAVAPAPELKGYNFVHWKVQGQETTYAIGTSIESLKTDINLEAVYTAEEYTLTFQTGLASAVKGYYKKTVEGTDIEWPKADDLPYTPFTELETKTVKFGEQFTVGLTDPSKMPTLSDDKFKFLKWELTTFGKNFTANDNDPYTFTDKKVPSSTNFKISALYAIKIPVVFDVADIEGYDGAKPDVSTLAMNNTYGGDSIKLPEAPVVEGLTFMGWSNGSRTLKAGVNQTVAVNDDASAAAGTFQMKFSAIYKRSANITFVIPTLEGVDAADLPTTPEAVVGIIGETITTPKLADIVKDEKVLYTFVGWEWNNGETIIPYDPEIDIPVTQDMTLTAVYQKNETGSEVTPQP